jgi:DNA-binding MarR family transcriptional regulator
MAIAQGPAETADLMFSCFKRMRRLVDNELSECGLSLSRTKLLSELSRNGPLHQGALATTFGLAPRTVTELVDTLERDGLVERRMDPADRRARQVLLTAAGEEARARAVAIREQIIGRVLGRLNEPQLAALRDSLQVIEDEIDKIDAGLGSTGGTDAICEP